MIPLPTIMIIIMVIIMIIVMIIIMIIIMTRFLYTRVINTYKYIARTVYIRFNSMRIAEPSIVLTRPFR